VAAIILGAGFAGLLVFPIGRVIRHQPAAGLQAANTGGNMHAIAKLLFTDYVFAFEAISALLIIAAVGAMILGHRERAGGKVTQRELMERRLREGGQLTPLPGPGVYARTDAADQPAMLPGGEPSQASLMPEYARGDSPGGGARSPAGPTDAGDADDVAGRPTDTSPGSNGTAPVGAGKGGGR
jgi:NADH-quinone oxidoreductase subunit J